MKRNRPCAPIHSWLCEPMPADVSESTRRLASLADVQHLAIMPDVHLAKDVCIGTVLATRDLLYPAAVGGDIGCGMTAMRFQAAADILQDRRNAAQLLSDLRSCIPTIRHSTATMPDQLPNELCNTLLSHPRLEKQKQRDGRIQFGTLGRGNHFLELQADQDNQLWLMVHSGSRGIGQRVSQHHTQATTDRSQGQPYLHSDSSAGQAYLSDLNWCLRYAELNRLAMVEAVAIILDHRFGISADRHSHLNCHHNHVLRETHFDKSWWVHRKGAQSARQGESGIVPGSMGTSSFHTEGRGCASSLQSCSHGAGRKLSRTDARRSITRRSMEQQLRGVWCDPSRVERMRDEAPGAYKNIDVVMRAQNELTKIVRTLSPILSYKG